MDLLQRWAAKVPVPARRPSGRRPDFLRVAAVLVVASFVVGTVVAVMLVT